LSPTQSLNPNANRPARPGPPPPPAPSPSLPGCPYLKAASSAELLSQSVLVRPTLPQENSARLASRTPPTPCTPLSAHSNPHPHSHRPEHCSLPHPPKPYVSLLSALCLRRPTRPHPRLAFLRRLLLHPRCPAPRPPCPLPPRCLSPAGPGARTASAAPPARRRHLKWWPNPSRAQSVCSKGKRVVGWGGEWGCFLDDMSMRRAARCTYIYFLTVSLSLSVFRGSRRGAAHFVYVYSHKRTYMHIHAHTPPAPASMLLLPSVHTDLNRKMSESGNDSMEGLALCGSVNFCRFRCALKAACVSRCCSLLPVSLRRCSKNSESLSG